MASLMHKISKTSASLRVLSTINAPLLPSHTASPISHQTHLGATKLAPTSSPAPVWGLSGGDMPDSSQSLHFFPTFPFGYGFNTAVSTDFEKLGVAETQHIELDDARTLWADSVKKKRKRKMNKHKYKKLRKRLRRKT